PCLPGPGQPARDHEGRPALQEDGVSAAHREAILDQFTRQAVPFATAPSIRDEAALETVIAFSGCGPGDTVLDVACGPGILACAFAKAGLGGPRQTFYRRPSDLEGLLSRSFPSPGDADRIRETFQRSLADDGLDMAPHRVGGTIRLSYPVAVLAARR